jgi:predicted signal transduction protein with EAL and GGDEF domain
VLKSGLRPGDVVGRYGGEEFVGVVAGAGPESGRVVAERLRQAVETMLPPKGGPAKLTLSIGATGFDPRYGDERTDELLRRADMALYAAKRSGRNRVVLMAAGQSVPDASDHDSRGSLNIPYTTPPDKPHSNVMSIDVPVLSLERLRPG